MVSLRKTSILISLLVVISGGLVFKAGAQNDVYMKIRRGGFQPIAISIPPFTVVRPTDMSDELRNVIINDLEYSGFFYLVKAPDIASSEKDGESEAPWKAATAAEVQLEGSLAFEQPGKLKISAQLKQLPGGHTIFSKDYSAEFGDLRWLAHRVADEVVYYLIGEKGIASSRIAYATGKGLHKEIALIDYDGYDFHKITDTGALNLSPAWSPDGCYLLFTSYITGNPDLVKMNMASGKLKQISGKTGLNSAPAWSPEGDKVAFTYAGDGNSDIYIMESDGDNLRKLTTSRAIDSSPSWAPTGKQIAFTSDRSGNPQIYVMDAEGGNVRRLTYEGKYNDSPAWSPRGDRIAFVSREDGRFQIYTISVTGDDLRRITAGEGNNENPSWSPNGLKIAFTSDRAGGYDIYVIDWNGTNLKRLTRSGKNISPEWSPRLKLKD